MSSATPFYQCEPRKSTFFPRARRLVSSWLCVLGALAVLIWIVMGALFLFVNIWLDASEREAAWRLDRDCNQIGAQLNAYAAERGQDAPCK